MSEEQQQLEALHEMFQSEGWAILKKDIEATVHALNYVPNIKDEAQLYTHKGKLQAFNELLFREHQVKDAV